MKKRRKLNVALIQMASGEDKKKNLRDAIRLLKLAVDKGAEFVLFPETFNFRGNPIKTLAQREAIPGPSLKPFMDIAKDNRVWILAGSICEKATPKKAYNSSALIDNTGRIIAIYRNMHLFDASLGKKKILESKIYLRGRQPVMVSVAGINTGLSICYDLRFPELYRIYSKAGAQIICVPSSFTHATGKAHWEVLLRARAIENQCFIVAPNQCGISADGVEAYGNSMVISPWGEIMAMASGTREEIIYAELSLDKLMQVRSRLSCLKHRRIWK